MKTLSQYINESATPVHYDEENHIVTYNLGAISDKRYNIMFNNLMLGVNSKQLAYNEVYVDVDYAADVLALRAPASGNTRKMCVWTFKTKTPLDTFYDKRETDLSAKDLKPYVTGKPFNMTGQNPDLDNKIAELLAYVFDNEPEPLFETPIKKARR
jgi:hypothetical protein